MTITSVNKVSITGIVSVLPEISCENIDESSSSAREEMARIVASTGIRARRVASADQTALSLGKVACESLIDAMDWKPEEISLVVFVDRKSVV